MISFIVPAHNEEAWIAATVKALALAARVAGEPHEILVVDDASTDRTATIAGECGARVIRVGHRHIAAARNAGARAARGELLVFVDADTLVSGAAVLAVLGAVRAGAIGGGCLVRFDEPLPRWARIAQPVFAQLMRTGLLAAGCFLFCTRDAFHAVGGFDERRYAAEEVALSLALKGHGPFSVVEEWVVTSGRKLRAYSGREILILFANLLRRGARSVESREGLELWYGPRREDPAAGKRA